MAKKLLLIALVAMMMASCYAVQLMAVDNNIQKLQLGMSRKEVLAIMGTKYTIVKYSATEDVIGYNTADNMIYNLSFEDGKLVSISRDIPAQRMLEYMRNYYPLPATAPATGTQGN